MPSAATPHIPEHHVVDNAVKMAQILLAGGPDAGETSDVDATESSPNKAEDPTENVEITTPAAPAPTKTMSTKPQTRRVRRGKDILKVKMPFLCKVKQLLGTPVAEGGNPLHHKVPQHASSPPNLNLSLRTMITTPPRKQLLLHQKRRPRRARVENQRSPNKEKPLKPTNFTLTIDFSR